MIFASMLLKFTSNVPCAKAILMDYGKCKSYCITVEDIDIEKVLFEDKSLEVQHINTGVSEGIVSVVH